MKGRTMAMRLREPLQLAQSEELCPE